MMLRRVILLCWVFVLSGICIAQRSEPARFEAEAVGKDQRIFFQPYCGDNVITIVETNIIEEKKLKVWDVVHLDSSLYELEHKSILLDKEMRLSKSGHSSSCCAFLFSDEHRKKNDTIRYELYMFDNESLEPIVMHGRFPRNYQIRALHVLETNIMILAQSAVGTGELHFYSMKTSFSQQYHLALSNDFIFAQSSVLSRQNCYVVSAKEFKDKVYYRTSFLLFSPDGKLIKQFQYDNPEHLTLGRMCFDADVEGRLVVYATLERYSNRKRTAIQQPEELDKTSLGVVWLKFNGNEASSKIYLFKNMRGMEKALSGEDMLRVKEDDRQRKKKNDPTKKEISFLLSVPQLCRFGALNVFSAEAFRPSYHTETRMEYGFYGMMPQTYTIFDGFENLSTIILAFDDDGELKWNAYSKFDPVLSYNLASVSFVYPIHDELVVAQASDNTINYEVFSPVGHKLLSNEKTRIKLKNSSDRLEYEDFSRMSSWYGNRFLISGSQTLLNSSMKKGRREVVFLQKVQFE